MSQISQKDFGWKTLGPWRRGQGSIASRLGKELIESGMILDGSDTIPGHVPVQET